MIVSKLYKGFGVAMASNFLYWLITFSTYERLNKYFDKKVNKLGGDFEYLTFLGKNMMIFGTPIANAIITSVLLYPLDTFKRQLQVNGGAGFDINFLSFSQSLKKFQSWGFIEMYRGFSLHLISKAIP